MNGFRSCKFVNLSIKYQRKEEIRLAVKSLFHYETLLQLNDNLKNKRRKKKKEREVWEENAVVVKSKRTETDGCRRWKSHPACESEHEREKDSSRA
jgi:hypothetical protein